MISQLIFFVGILAPGSLAMNLAAEKTWTYTILSINSSSGDEKLLKFDLKMERVGRGEFAISGSIVLGIEVTDEDCIEFESYYSATGSKDYNKLPFKIAKQTVNSFMQTTYKKMLMKSLANCSNLPQSDNPVIEKMTYTLSKCVISNEACPSYLKEGYYKVLLTGTGGVSYNAEFIVEVEKKV